MFYLCHDINQVYVSKWQFEFKMKKYLIILITIFVPLLMHAQSFKGYYYNDEYQLYLIINADSCNIEVPDQQIYGQLAGYFGSKRDSRLWLITECKRINDKKVEITVINDYGSEDFTAILTEEKEGYIKFKHKEGSTFKIVVNSKYVKIPKELVLHH